MPSRRKLLVATAVFASIGGAQLYSALRAHDPLRLFQHPDSARAIGEAYLKSLPAAPAHAQLHRRLFEGAQPTGEALVRWLGAKQREDFSKGRLVEVDGFLFSRTEAELCALLALE